MSRRQAVPHVRFIFAGYSGEYAVGSGYVLVSLRAYASACALLPVGNTVAFVALLPVGNTVAFVALSPFGDTVAFVALSPFGDTGFGLRLCARFTARIRLRLRPIACRQYGRSFLPVCAPTASASPRGRRERTLVRPLALGLASLYLHQTDKKAFVALSPFGDTGFGGGYVLVSLRAYASAF